MKPCCANCYVEAMKGALHKYCVLHTLSAETAHIIHVYILHLNNWVCTYSTCRQLTLQSATGSKQAKNNIGQPLKVCVSFCVCGNRHN